MNDEISAEYERLCQSHMNMLKRYLFHKISNYPDMEDVLQNVLLAAYKGFDNLKSKDMFKSWIIGIASHKCVDYYKAKAKKLEIPLDEISGIAVDRYGAETVMTVHDTLNMLRGKDKQILYLFYIKGFNQKDISAKLGIPLGTVKSRISTAKENFKSAYKKGESTMKNKKFPNTAPQIIIEKMPDPPFEIKYEELPGSMLPRVGEKNSFAVYSEENEKRLIGVKSHECVREAVIHGIPCVQIDCEAAHDDGKTAKNTFFVRITETHVSFIAEIKIQDNIFYMDSLYDDEWLGQFKIGENNIGREIHQEAKGILQISGNGAITAKQEGIYDIIGRYRISIGSRAFDTVALADISGGIMHIAYICQDGRSVLCRRYNRFDWKTDHYKALWTDKLPNSEILTVNDEQYVHWFDCVSDYAL